MSNVPLIPVLGFSIFAITGSAQNVPTPSSQTSAPNRMGVRGGFPLPTLPAVFETAQQRVRVSVVARGLDRPWSLLMLPNDDMLVSMRFSNQIRLIRDGVLDPKPVSGLPEMRRLFDIVLHPQFAQNNWVYLDYSKAGTDPRTPLALARAVYQNGTLTNVQELYVSDPVTQGASRMAFAPDGTIYYRQRRGRPHRERSGSAEARYGLRQGDPVARRWFGASRQSVCRKGRCATRNLYTWAS
jgi:glucose/arabinose dehydrogenase